MPVGSCAAQKRGTYIIYFQNFFSNHLSVFEIRANNNSLPLRRPGRVLRSAMCCAVALPSLAAPAPPRGEEAM